MRADQRKPSGGHWSGRRRKEWNSAGLLRDFSRSAVISTTTGPSTMGPPSPTGQLAVKLWKGMNLPVASGPLSEVPISGPATQVESKWRGRQRSRDKSLASNSHLGRWTMTGLCVNSLSLKGTKVIFKRLRPRKTKWSKWHLLLQRRDEIETSRWPEWLMRKCWP